MIRYLAALATTAALLTLTGCANFYQQPHHDPEVVQYSQNSVRDIFIAQRYNPNASEENSGIAVTGMDGERSRLILQGWRERKPNDEALNEEIELDMSSGGE